MSLESNRSNGMQNGFFSGRSFSSLTSVVQTVINLGPDTINQYANDLGPWLYAVLFLYHFCRYRAGSHAVPPEGDSLLFAVGAVAVRFP